jgi:hypothetical protein
MRSAAELGVAADGHLGRALALPQGPQLNARVVVRTSAGSRLMGLKLVQRRPHKAPVGAD